MIRNHGKVLILFGGVAIVIAAVVVMAHPSIAELSGKPAAPSPLQSSSASQPGSSGPGAAVWDPKTGRVLTLPPAEAAAAIRSYWTPQRMAQARPAP